MRKKDLRLNSLSGIAQARKLRDKVTGLMRDAGANPDDAIVLCVFAEPDLSPKLPMPAMLGVQNGASDLALAAQSVDKLPIGFLVFVVDRSDPQNPVFGHYRPLIVEDPRAIALNEKALQTCGQLIQQGQLS